MIDPGQFALFLAAAVLLAATPGPGIFYVTARTLSGGRGEGIASSFGNGLGSLVHVTAGAVHSGSRRPCTEVFLQPPMSA